MGWMKKADEFVIVEQHATLTGSRTYTFKEAFWDKKKTDEEMDSKRKRTMSVLSL